MKEQKIIRVYIDPVDGTKAMEQIRTAAGDDSWRVVSLLSIGGSVPSHSSPGPNDPHSLESEPVLVLVEREVSAHELKADLSLLEAGI
jgi:hypothetical protein